MRKCLLYDSLNSKSTAPTDSTCPSGGIDNWAHADGMMSEPLQISYKNYFRTIGTSQSPKTEFSAVKLRRTLQRPDTNTNYQPDQTPVQSMFFNQDQKISKQ